MSISNQASGIRPGVCTSTTRPTGPYTGQIIYETDTGYLLVWDGSAWDYFSPKQDTIPGAWLDWTPTFTPTTGAITTASLIRARYSQVNKIVNARLEYAITTAGTAAGAFLDFTLPVTMGTYSTGAEIGFGRESGTTGNTLNIIRINATTVRFTTYANGGVIQNSYTLTGILTYEAA